MIDSASRFDLKGLPEKKAIVDSHGDQHGPSFFGRNSCGFQYSIAMNVIEIELKKSRFICIKNDYPWHE